MNTLHISAIDPGTRQPIKRKAHLFSLLTVLAAAGAGVYLFLPDARMGLAFWCLLITAMILAIAAALLWVFERPRDSLLYGSPHRRSSKQLE